MDTTWLRLMELVISAANAGSSRVHWFSRAAWGLAGKEVRVMEVIKIPWQHVDACLFFHPGREGGELPGHCTVLLSAKTESGQSVRETEDLMEDEGDERQMRGGMCEAEGRRVEGWREGGSG